MNPEFRKFYFAFDEELDSKYELPHGMSYAKALKIQRPDVYYGMLALWADRIVQTKDIPQTLMDEALKEEGLQ